MRKPEDGSRVSVAVVGSGMAGLVSGFLLANDKKQRFDVQIFEAQDQLSLDSASATVTSKEDGTPQGRVDLPMRAFAGGFYDNLRNMYDYLGVKYRPQAFLFTLSQLPRWDGRAATPYFVHSSNSHRLPPVRPEACGFWQWVAETVYLLLCYAWYVMCCFAVPPKEAAQKASSKKSSDGCETVGQYFHRIRLPNYFLDNYLIPAISSITTCSHDTLRGFPASDIIDYKRLTYNKPHYLVYGGVHIVQEKLAKGLKVQLNSRVTRVENRGTKICVSWIDTKNKASTAAQQQEQQQQQQKLFDHVILAVTPNVVGELFPPLRTAMSQVPTMSVETVVHTDTSAITSLSLSPMAEGASQTIHLCSLNGATESIHEHRFSVLVSTAPVTPIESSKVIHRTYLTRVLRTPRSREVINQIFGEGLVTQGCVGGGDEEKKSWCSGDGNVWLVGGWCWDGMVLLEGCIVSAMRVADRFGVEVPWCK
ncbi:hypothetical protein AJ80_02409 [Polytolypa hystricis UAMH7299]|uniref:Amine oxidase domain-containing protein n=1 Tax=Polytolypa hystricis (strain UAMH7299) TaxID=1447883 RepID=A0A2B7YP82_POLH7|nr:hypothetical protein AJ80_02409 [Polytolypa hystricis UAMH7299]